MSGIRGILWCLLIVFINCFIQLDCMNMWGYEQLFPPHKIPEEALDPRRATVRRKIVLYHNFFRTKVQPPAANMLMMSWHPGAAKQAQRYAEKCVFLEHNSPSENTVPYLGTCGQNLFAAGQKTPWFFPIKTWFLEYQNFTYGTPVTNLKAVGHYTQMVWATSYKVGCGVARCSGGPWGQFYNYVCHYCPGGNYDMIVQYPYKVGRPCGDCAGECVSNTLCINYCPVRDYYNNCNELMSYPETCQQGLCNATCICGNRRIHKNYPF